MQSTSIPTAGQAWDAQTYAHNTGFVSELGADILTTLAATRGKGILDMGCGDGTLALRIRDAGATVTGLEPDPSMAAPARARGLEVAEHLAARFWIIYPPHKRRTSSPTRRDAWRFWSMKPAPPRRIMSDCGSEPRAQPYKQTNKAP